MGLEDTLLLRTNFTQPIQKLEQEEVEHEFKKVLLANEAVIQFVELEIDEEYLLDVIESCECNMDTYIKVAKANLEEFLNY